MALSIPLHARTTFNSNRVEDEPVILLAITDTASLGGTVLRYCSYPVVRLAELPLQYGVVSQGSTYVYALTGHLPSDQEGAPPSSQLVIDNVDQALTEVFIGLTVDNIVQIQLVLATAPDEVIRAYTNLHIVQVVNNDEGQLALTIERNVKVSGGSTTVEPWPSGRQTINQAPGLHRQ